MRGSDDGVAWAGSLKHLHHTATLLTTPSGHCRVDTGCLPTRQDTNLFRYFLFSMPSCFSFTEKIICHKPPCLCSHFACFFCEPIWWFCTWFGEINFPRRTARGQQAGKPHPVLTMTITMLAVWRQRGSAGLTDWLIEAVAASGQHRDCSGQQTCNPCVTLFSMVSIMLENTTKHLWTGG